ncbi:MAG: hypothetical protein CMH30_03740 [Micavibrio sp.]|nr:hypothetical protein [Micavibrio sp.]|tara:strand:+ start:2243 stop:2635 length:393 start_codon:yes stop_codon:yes gene_type:complete
MKAQLLLKITSNDVLVGTGDKKLARIFRFHSANRKVFNVLFTLSGLAAVLSIAVVATGLMPVVKEAPLQVLIPFGLCGLTTALSYPRIQSEKKLAQIYQHPKLDAILEATNERVVNKAALNIGKLNRYNL